MWRLKKTWAEVSKRRAEQFERLLRLADPQNSYGSLRQEIAAAAPPRIPFLGCYLTLLVLVHDGMQPMIVANVIHFERYRKMASILNEVG